MADVILNPVHQQDEQHDSVWGGRKVKGQCITWNEDPPPPPCSSLRLWWKCGHPRLKVNEVCEERFDSSQMLLTCCSHPRPLPLNLNQLYWTDVQHWIQELKNIQFISAAKKQTIYKHGQQTEIDNMSGSTHTMTVARQCVKCRSTNTQLRGMWLSLRDPLLIPRETSASRNNSM